MSPFVELKQLRKLNNITKHSNAGLENHSTSFTQALKYRTYKYAQKRCSGIPQEEGKNSLLEF